MTAAREEISFASGDAECAAWLLRPSGGHFDIYVDGGLERAVADQLGFLDRSLGR